MPGLISWTTDQSDSQKLHKTDNIHKLHNALTTYLDQINKPEKQNERDNERDNIVEMIQYTREINYHDSKGNTPLHLAVATQDPVIVAAVMARKPELQRTNTLGRTALHEAVARSNTKIVPLLLPAENSFLLDINPSQTHLLGQLDKSGITPIDIALIHDNPAMLKVLLNYKVNPVQSKIIIINALCYGAEKCFSLLLQYDCKLVSCSIKNDATPLHFACAYNLESCIDMIITSFHFDPEKHLDRQDGNGFTPIFMAARSGNRACMEKLIKAGARTDMLDYKRRSLIAVACYPCAKNSIRHSDELKNIVTDTVSTLIQSGVDTNVLMDGGQSCLHLVAQTDNVRLFKLLLNKGLDPSLQDKMGRTPLHYAADNGSASIIKLLLDTIANANMTDRDGLLPLHLACGLNNEVVEQKDINATIRHLLRKTDDPNRLSITNVTPLLLACRNGLTSNILEMLSSETHYKPPKPGAAEHLRLTIVPIRLS